MVSSHSSNKSKILAIAMIGILLLSVVTLMITTAYGQLEDYQIDEEAANETVDKLKGQAISLIQIIAQMVHTAVGGSIDTFYQDDVNPAIITGITIVVTVVIAFGAALRVGSHATKLAIIIIVALVVIFMAIPMFEPQIPQIPTT